MIFLPVFGQTPSVIENIRIPLWALVDAVPGTEEAADLEAGNYDYAVKNIRNVASYLIGGMVYGWKFVYTPSDKARGVEEFFEITPIQSLNEESHKIKYTSPWLQDEKLNCWCEFKRTEPQIQNYNLWSSIQHPVIQGRGYGALSKGFDGITDGAADALKAAVRNHYRSKIKNKPKEIRGSVLIRDIPTIGITSGQYVINLDFFLEYDKIIDYKMY